MANSKLIRNSGRARRRPSANAVSISDTGEKAAVSRLKSIPPAIAREYAEQIARRHSASKAFLPTQIASAGRPFGVWIPIELSAARGRWSVRL
jgi:hypothetical protein